MKRTLLPPNRQKNDDQKQRLECSYAKTTLLWPPLLFDGRQLSSWKSKVKSIVSEKSQKSRKNCQKSRFFEKFWLLSLPTCLRAITLLPVLDRTALWKSWKFFKKLLAGMTFLKKSVFDPPNRPKVQFTRFQPRWDHIKSHFFTISRPHAKSHQLLTARFRDRKTFCTLDP